MTNKITFRISVLLMLLSFIIVTCCSCVDEKYDKKWIIGKTSSEIEERYGKFDILLNNEKDENVIRINSRTGKQFRKHIACGNNGMLIFGSSGQPT